LRNSSEQNLAEFIRATFGSVWTLELLLLLTGDAERAWTEAELVSSLRASDLIVTRAIQELTAAGIVLIEQDRRVRYGPVSEPLRKMVKSTEKFYATSPDKVRRLIVEARASGLKAFADAFRIWKD
jgi:hypothetical protein